MFTFLASYATEEKTKKKMIPITTWKIFLKFFPLITKFIYQDIFNLESCYDGFEMTAADSSVHFIALWENMWPTHDMYIKNMNCIKDMICGEHKANQPINMVILSSKDDFYPPFFQIDFYILYKHYRWWYLQMQNASNWTV